MKLCGALHPPSKSSVFHVIWRWEIIVYVNNTEAFRFSFSAAESAQVVKNCLTVMGCLCSYHNMQASDIEKKKRKKKKSFVELLIEQVSFSLIKMTPYVTSSSSVSFATISVKLWWKLFLC